MKHVWSLDEVRLDDACLTIGSFDGVHRGHQYIVRSMVEAAHRASSPAAVLTFYPHPAVVLRGQTAPFYLSTPEERAALLGELGVDLVITQPFSRDLAQTTAADFMAWLKRQLGLRQLWVGHDFALGRGREGNTAHLQQLGEQMGFTLHVLPPLDAEGQIISSSAIRTLLQAGQVAQAADMLGRRYRLSGEVVRGDGRGRSLGIPTANLSVWSGKLLPAHGVYACWAHFEGRAWGAATNIGIRPTFDGNAVAPHVEAHMLDFDGDLYGCPVELEFVEHLRGEVRFASVFDLLTQVQQDIARTRQLLAALPAVAPL